MQAVGGNTRARLMLAGRIVLSAGLLAFLLTRVHLHALVPDWGDSAALWLIGGLLVTLAGVVVSTIRWQRVLLALDMPARLLRLLSHQFKGS